MTRVQSAGVGDPLKAIAAGPLGLGEDETLFAGATFEDGETDPLFCYRTIAAAIQFCFRAKVSGGAGVFSFEFIQPIPPYTIPYADNNPDDVAAADDVGFMALIACHGEHRIKITFTPDADESGSIDYVHGSEV